MEIAYSNLESELIHKNECLIYQTSQIEDLTLQINELKKQIEIQRTQLRDMEADNRELLNQNIKKQILNRGQELNK